MNWSVSYFVFLFCSENVIPALCGVLPIFPIMVSVTSIVSLWPLQGYHLSRQCEGAAVVVFIDSFLLSSAYWLPVPFQFFNCSALWVSSARFDTFISPISVYYFYQAILHHSLLVYPEVEYSLRFILHISLCFNEKVQYYETPQEIQDVVNNPHLTPFVCKYLTLFIYSPVCIFSITSHLVPSFVILLIHLLITVCVIVIIILSE